MHLYDLLEGHVTISNRLKDSTEAAVSRLRNQIESMDNSIFSALIGCTGHIPDLYPPDSSPETLYSKFVELLVCEWARRVGFDKSYLQTTKSSVEDVVITDGKCLIVADAKAFRLGRSQAAPNVKDVIKQGDYQKWLAKHTYKEQLGGLVTYPSAFEWKRGSDVHQYLTDKKIPILMLYYDHLSYFIDLGINKEKVISYYKAHPILFPGTLGKETNNKEIYLAKMEDYFFGEYKIKFLELKKKREKNHQGIKRIAITKLEKAISKTRTSVEQNLRKHKSYDQLLQKSIDIISELEVEQFVRLKNNIEKFR